MVQVEWFKKRCMGDIVEVASQRWGDRTALIYEGQEWTYSELSSEVDRVAKGLMAAGIDAGDHVAVWMVNRPEWIFLQFAISRVGGVLVGLNTRYRLDDFSYVVDQADCKMLIAVSRSGPINFAEMIGAATPSLPKLASTVIIGDELPDGASSWDDFVAGGESISDESLKARAASVDPDAPALIVFTSGTTSNPKGAMHTHIGMRQFNERARILGYSKSDVHMNYLPMFHVYGLIEVSLMASLTGATQVLMEVFDADKALDLAEKYNANILHGFDAHWLDFLKAQKKRPRRIDMRLGTLPAGTENSAAIAYEVQDVFGPTVSGFGMSELLPFVALSHPLDTREQRCEASGYPMIDVEFRTVDPESGQETPVSSPGVLQVRGYSTMIGYYNKPEATAETIDKDGWLDTGDLGYIRPDGHLVFLGRQKDMLKIGGENVSPAEIEARMRQIPGVFDVSVVGVRDERLGEVAFAFVIKDDSAGDLCEEDISEALRGRVASFKIPRYVQFVEQFPSTASGKVRKVELRDRATKLAVG